MSSPRIIAGKAKGLRLKSPPGQSTRPITDRVKESLFNILGSDIEDASFLDLFAGTGSVGIEALSRGAKFVRFIEYSKVPFQLVRENVLNSKLSEKADILKMDAFNYLKSDVSYRFDYIFVAPPQYKQLWIKALLELDTQPSHLDVDGWIIVQIDPKEYKQINLKYFFQFDHRKYGNTLLIFYHHSMN